MGGPRTTAKGSRPTDFELLDAWRGGDDQAGNELFDRHSTSVFRFFRNKVGPAAEDLAQKTFLGCVEGRDRVRGDSSFRTYLFAIARNQLLMYLRSKATLERRFEPDICSVVDMSATPGHLAVRQEEQAIVAQALQHIPVDSQIALELFYWAEMSLAEIATVLGIAEGTVKSRLSRGRSRLRECISEMVESQDLLVSTVGDLERWMRSLNKCAAEPDSQA
jgi:RNA polymerase sigma-70 factor (ECF subfamily)